MLASWEHIDRTWEARGSMRQLCGHIAGKSHEHFIAATGAEQGQANRQPIYLCQWQIDLWPTRVPAMQVSMLMRDRRSRRADVRSPRSGAGAGVVGRQTTVPSVSTACMRRRMASRAPGLRPRRHRYKLWP